MKEKNIKMILAEYGILTLGTLLLIFGDFLFKFPNNFSFGGVTGFAVILTAILPWSASALTFVINMALLVLGFIFLDRSFGFKTIYVSVLFSAGLAVLDRIHPMTGTLTNQPVLELIFAIVMPALSAAVFFNLGASSGGTDIVAMILKKYTSINIGTALMIVDSAIAVSAFVFYGPTTGLFSVTGLLAKSLVIDTAIENINLCKFFTIVCDDAEPICDFIHNELDRSATVYHAEGAYSHNDKTIILTVMKRSQAVQLRNFIKKTQPTAFLMITNSSEIIGKGFRGLN
jgi:uncharacterized membrane-anchored protein YitT (DUF2179 family)